MCSLKVAGLETVLGTEHNWAMMLSLSLIPALTQYLVLPFCPESPRYLLINRGEERKAEAGRCLCMTGCMMLVLVIKLVTSWTVRQRETRLLKLLDSWMTSINQIMGVLLMHSNISASWNYHNSPLEDDVLFSLTLQPC